MKASIGRSGRSCILTFILAVGILASLSLGLRAQTTATTIQAGTFTLTAGNVSSLESLPDWQLQSVLQTLAGTPLIWPDALPDGGMGGTYYSLAHPDWPPLPTAFGSPVWNLTSPSGSDFYLMDDLDYPPVPGDGDTNGVGGGIEFNFQPLVFSSNDLWLQLDSVSNNIANLVIHPPWNSAGDVYDLLYCTNLAPPISWKWLLRSNPGQTNLAVANATDDRGFYRLVSPNDFVANDSWGTNFWIAFFRMPSGGSDQISIYISSSMGATGTVIVPKLDMTNAFSVAGGCVTNISIPLAAMITDYDTSETNGIHITASQPVSVYGLNYYPEGSAAFACYPTSLFS